MLKIFEVRAIITNKYDRPAMLVCMDLETYNRALEAHMDFLKDACFNEGFEAGQCPYPTEEELELMDADRTENDSQENNS